MSTYRVHRPDWCAAEKWNGILIDLGAADYYLQDSEGLQEGFRPDSIGA